MDEDKVLISREQLARLTAASEELSAARAEFETTMEGWAEDQRANRPPSQAQMTFIKWAAIGVFFGVIGSWTTLAEGKGLAEGLKALVGMVGFFAVIGIWRATKKMN